jgi:hypothetical protein
VNTSLWWGNLRKRDHWGDPGVDGRIILRMMEGRDLHRFLVWKPDGKDHWGVADVDGRIILRRIEGRNIHRVLEGKPEE